MAYIKKRRRYQKEVDLVAQSSEDEEQVHVPVGDAGNEENVDQIVCDFSDHSLEIDPVHESEDHFEALHDSIDSFVDVSSSTESEIESTEEGVPDIQAELSKWATKSGCTRSSLNDLSILREQGLRVPRDARTLLKTPRSITTIPKCGGDYLYLGIES